MIQSAIFDLDGTLIDSTHVWEKVDEIFLKKRGIELPSDYVKKVQSCGFYEAAVYTIQRFSLHEQPEQVMNEWYALVDQEYKYHIQMKNGAKEYLFQLKGKGIKLGIASALSPVLYEAVLQNHGILDIFDFLCSTEMVGKGKEHPDVFLYAADNLKSDPSQCVVYEDILPAMQSARKAGMEVWGVYDQASADDWETICDFADQVIVNWDEAPFPG